MGEILSKPITDKTSFDEEDSSRHIRYGVSSMQGWRVGMEDAHLTRLTLDKRSSLFGVFDGHAGREVALYVAEHLPDLLVNNETYQEAIKAGEGEIDAKLLGEALTSTYMQLDRNLLTPEAIKELEMLSEDKIEKDSDVDSSDERAEADELVSEATMPLGKLLAKYGDAVCPDADEDNEATVASKRERLIKLAAQAGYEIDFDEDTSSENDEGDGEEVDSTEAGSSTGKKRKSFSSRRQAAVKADEKLAAEKGSMKDGNEDEDEDEDDGDEDDEDEDDDDESAEDDSSNEVDVDEGLEDVGTPEETSGEEDDDGGIEEEDDFELQEGVGVSSGTTAVSALLIDGKLVVANTGDSRCVLCRGGQAIAMTEDHNPQLDKERERIERAGGRVDGNGRVHGGLNMSRALGDHGYKTNADLPLEEQMISPLPDIQVETITEDDEFLILACDGIWNVMSNQECVDFVRKRWCEDGKPVCLSAICEEVCDFCLSPDALNDDSGADNMTIMIVELQSTCSEESNSSSMKSSKRKAHSDSPAAKRLKR